ncbi:MAG: ATP synthase F1 subunit delta [Candidatus Baltobacteraceae bacterium]|jgi:F-type H+-transporting ATPase subunit delta
MQNETVARRYASAVLSLAREAGKTETIGANLRTASEAIFADAETRRFFLSPVFVRTQKAQVLASIFEGKLDELALHTVLLLVRKRREALLPAIVAEYDKLALSAAGKEPLEIVSARPLGQAETDRIVARLSALYGATFEVNVKVDPSLLGGVRITMGDRSIDGSIAGRLDQVARELVPTAPTAIGRSHSYLS